MSASLTVLFVDDEPNILRAMRRHLRPYRHEWDMHFAEGGNQAIDIMGANAVDVVVTDMRMPEVDGAQLLEWISQHQPEVMRFVLSGEAQLEEIYRIVGRSHRFLAKPCAPDEVVGVIKNLIEARRCDQAENGTVRLPMLDRLSTPAGRFRELSAALERQDPCIGEIAGIIRQDPSLSLRALQLANSAYFKRAISTCEISRAVSHIGIDRIRDILAVGRLGQESRGAVGPEDGIEMALKLASNSETACRSVTDCKETLAAAYAVGLCLRCGAIDSSGKLSQAARRADLLSVLFGLPEILRRALQHLGAASLDAPVEQWPHLIAETVRNGSKGASRLSEPRNQEVAA